MINFEKVIKSGKHISSDEYVFLYDKFENLGIKARKLEFLQTYDFIDENNDFKSGEYEKFLDTLKEFHKNAWGGKDNMRRIHYVEYPLNDYLKMEYYTYLINDFYGQKIRVTNNRKLFPKKTYDFILFENGNLFILDFGNNDSFKGVWHVTESEIIHEVSLWYDNVFEKCESFKKMLVANKEILNKMKQFGLIKDNK